MIYRNSQVRFEWKHNQVKSLTIYITKKIFLLYQFTNHPCLKFLHDESNRINQI